jgi:hypothetical protein
MIPKRERKKWRSATSFGSGKEELRRGGMGEEEELQRRGGGRDEAM